MLKITRLIAEHLSDHLHIDSTVTTVDNLY